VEAKVMNKNGVYKPYIYISLLVLAFVGLFWLGDERLASDFENPLFPVGEYLVTALDWTVDNYRDFFQILKQPATTVLGGIEKGLIATSPIVLMIVISLLAWQIAGIRTALLIMVCLFSISAIGAWAAAMTTLAIVLTSVIFCSVVGIPLGILAARSKRVDAVLRPVLDFLQTVPAFVYLVPIVKLFGIGNVPGVIVTIIYAIAPVIRLTSLGIRQVQTDMVEASHAFGASETQTLLKVQIPLAMPTIMAGVNQTIMMALAMTVVASMISVTGLGQMVLRGIGRLDMNIATVGGLGIVMLAIVVDRFSQGFAVTARERGHLKWYQHGPIGIIHHLVSRIKHTRATPDDLTSGTNL
jgi:glycine betaine/proline transport system permease protein